MLNKPHIEGHLVYFLMHQPETAALFCTLRSCTINTINIIQSINENVKFADINKKKKLQTSS